jgi:hypothetical protein
MHKKEREELERIAGCLMDLGRVEAEHNYAEYMFIEINVE